MRESQQAIQEPAGIEQPYAARNEESVITGDQVIFSRDGDGGTETPPDGDKTGYPTKQPKQ